MNTDGAARGNPGPAAIGVAIVDATGAPVAEISARIGERTNNQAEYEAMLVALRELTRLKPAAAVIRTDSELLYFQMTGAYRVKNHELALLKAEACRLLAGLHGIRFELVPREQNRVADRLANRAFSKRPGGKPQAAGAKPLSTGTGATNDESRTSNDGSFLSLFDEQ